MGCVPTPSRDREFDPDVSGLKYNLFPLPGQACPESIEGKGVRGPVLSPIEGMVRWVSRSPVRPQCGVGIMKRFSATRY